MAPRDFPSTSARASAARASSTSSTGPSTSFSAKMRQANDRLICSASAGTVRTVAMGEVLKHRLRIPFFQRRYCWSPPQWATLLRDVKACCGGRHALGRMTCAVGADGRLLVIDGQQRTTTCVLFLAACRDAPAADAALRAAVDAVLFPDGAALAAPERPRVILGLDLGDILLALGYKCTSMTRGNSAPQGAEI